MKVGVNTLFLIPGEVGGTETYLCQTLLAIAENHPDDQLVLFTNAENDSMFRKQLSGFPQIDYMCLDFRARNRYSRIIREQIQLPSFVRRAGTDLLWSPGYTAPFSCACPQVVTIPDMQYKSFPQDMTFLARITTDLLVNMAVRRCRRIIAISQFSKSEIVRYTGATESRVDVTHLAVDESFGAPVSDERLRQIVGRLNPAGRPYILCVANTYPHKNVHELAGAFAAISGEIPHQLLIIGRPRLGEETVRRSIEKVCDKSRVTRIEYVDSAELPAIYQAADCFVFPSLYEGFGLPVLEAMLAGVPVVTTKCASIPEIGGDSVFYCGGNDVDELARQIKHVVTAGKSGLSDMLGRAKSAAAGFTWSKTASATIQSFRKALET